MNADGASNVIPRGGRRGHRLIGLNYFLEKISRTTSTALKFRISKLNLLSRIRSVDPYSLDGISWFIHDGRIVEYRPSRKNSIYSHRNERISSFCHSEIM